MKRKYGPSPAPQKTKENRIMKRKIAALFTTVFCFWLANASLLIAAEEVVQSEGPSPTVWAVPYILVIMAICLGFMVLVSPVRRDDKRRED